MIFAAGATLGDSVKNQGDYHLFRPVPDELLRELSTDRPDKTESPYTVDAGHFQIESDLINYTRDEDTSGGNAVRTESFSAAAINLKAGLLPNADLQFVFEPFISERIKDRDAGSTVSRSGHGDLITRLKVNLWGNDEGQTAFAIMPFVKFPTHRRGPGNNSVEGGVILPLAVSLPQDWSMGVMTEFDVMRDGEGGGHHAEFINSITFGHAICGELSGYIEFFSWVSAETDSDWAGTLDVGLTYGLSRNTQLDCGVNFGVTSSADDLNPFLGLSVRF